MSQSQVRLLSFALPKVCCENNCTAKPDYITIGAREDCSVAWAFCASHAAEAMDRARDELKGKTR